MVKKSSCDAGVLGSIPGLGRSPGEGNGYPLQYSCLKILWTEDLGGLQSMELQKVRHNWATNRNIQMENKHMKRCSTSQCHQSNAN